MKAFFIGLGKLPTNFQKQFRKNLCENGWNRREQLDRSSFARDTRFSRP